MLTTTTATLDTNNPQYQLDAVTGFTQLTITATASNGTANAALPILELKLQNDAELFTMFLQPVPGTLHYTTTDVLAVARQLPALEQTLFNRLLVTVTEPDALQAEQGITLTFHLAE